MISDELVHTRRGVNIDIRSFRMAILAVRIGANVNTASVNNFTDLWS